MRSSDVHEQVAEKYAKGSTPSPQGRGSEGPHSEGSCSQRLPERKETSERIDRHDNSQISQVRSSDVHEQVAEMNDKGTTPPPHGRGSGKAKKDKKHHHKKQEL